MKKTQKLLTRVLIWLLIALGVGMACCAAWILWDDTHVSLSRYDFYHDDLPLSFYGYRILCIADFHNSEALVDQLLETVDAEKPDIVLFLGDMTDLDSATWTAFTRLLDGISADIPVYGVTGNHEVYSPNRALVESYLEQSRMILLNNEKVTLTMGQESIDLLGIYDVGMTPLDIAGSWQLNEIRSFLQESVNPARFTLLACHRATMYPFLTDIPADLMLSGHLHGGQIRLPIVGGLIGEDGDFLPDYDAGYFQEADMTLLVSRGCNLNWKQLRVFNGPEVMLVTLRR